MMMDPSAAARALAARRRPKERICPVCGKPFTSVSGQARYCSRACLNRRYYLAHRERLLAERRQKKASPTDQAPTDTESQD